MERLLPLLLLGLFLLAVPVQAADRRRAMTLDDLFRFERVSDPQISPDGAHVAYVVTSVDLADNSTTSAIWLAATAGGEPRRLTTSGKKDRHPRWSPDGKHLLFESNRSGSNQLWLLPLAGGEATQLTTISSGAADAVWSPDGRWIAFVSAVYPEYASKPYKEADALNKKRQEEAEKGPVKARVFRRLFHRHWDAYVEDKRQHLFVLPYNGGAGGTPRNVTPGDRDAVPTSSTFSSGADFTFTPDSKYLVYTATPEHDEAWSTNFQLLRVPIKGGTPRRVTTNQAADGAPRFSPDGKRLAYRAQRRPGFEADRWEVLLADVHPDGSLAGPAVSLTAKFDLSVGELVWAGNDRLLCTHASGPQVLIGEIAVSGGAPRSFSVGHNSNLSVSADGSMLAFGRARLTHPLEVFAGKRNGDRFDEVSRANRKLLATLELPEPKSVTVKGAGGTPMQMWLLEPPGFDASKKWPVAYLVHGGPQGAWDDGWSFRWCPALWAARGYLVALPNPRGSTGFGQKYTDEISGDWGGKCYDDLMKGVDHVASLPFVDTERIGAAGASFGGYVMNWFAVNTGRFKCLITHCSVWNFESMYGTTDELWFDEWEHGGPPWGPGRKSYEKHSPHRLAANLSKFKTPMLVIHNDLDFRCPIGQGHELFTTLQRQGVPSRMINFPDEGHWVQKPRNSEFWHKEVFAWLEKYVPPGGR